MVDDRSLHARVCVLESDCKRHDEDITQLFEKVSALEICSSSLPEIKDRLIDVQRQVGLLRDANIQNSTRTGTIESLWQIINQPVSMFLALALLMTYLHIMGGAP